MSKFWDNPIPDTGLNAIIDANMDKERFLSRCGEINEVVSKMKEPLVVNHYDADGLTSGSIVKMGLKSMGKKVIKGLNIPYSSQC